MNQHFPALAPPTDLALWRYGLISALLHRDPGGRTVQELLDDAARPTYRDPQGRSRRLSPETLRKWLSRYRVSGLAGLADRKRSDSGATSVPPALIERIRTLRTEHPRWTLAVLFRFLYRENAWNGRTPSAAALYRFCRASGLERKPASPDDCRSFAFEEFGSLWVADFLHGPRVLVGKERRKTYIHVILDDATRFVVAGGIFLRESVDTLIAELKQAVRCHGVPQRFYSDNGAAYRSRHLRVVGGRLQIEMPHTPPYRPQGRGKIERFFRTVREQFLNVTSAHTFEELRQGFQAWISTYHQTLHETLECTPLQKRVCASSVCRVVPEGIPIDPLFFMERRCRVYNDGTVRFRRRSFEVTDCLPGSRVTVFYDPEDSAKIWYGETYQPARPLNRESNARRFMRPPARKETSS